MKGKKINAGYKICGQTTDGSWLMAHSRWLMADGRWQMDNCSGYGTMNDGK
jgi:hypothetical protein